MRKLWLVVITWLIVTTLLIGGCNNTAPNNPHPKDSSKKNIYYSSFNERPKTLDPARSYVTTEAVFTAQIYEPPLQYHLLKRPYQLVPLTASIMPEIKYYDKEGHQIDPTQSNQKVAYTTYDIEIKPGIYYQPHPAFAQNTKGFLYHNLSTNQLININTLSDFKETGTRELTAYDYVYQIKRLAHPNVQSPIFSLMSDYIVGLDDYAKTLDKAYQALSKADQHFLDLRKYDFEGVKVINRYKYQIKLKGQYPQFIYWLAMPFFAPVPWEADEFYSQPGLIENNITLDWFPVGTGPYMLTKNNPNLEMVMIKNPNFHGEKYPGLDSESDAKKGYVQDAGKALPFVDEFHLSLEKESIPRWNKFLQGYYDQSGIASDNFDQAIKMDAKGKPFLTKEMQQKNLQLQTTVTPAIFYLGFNMLDDVVGGNTSHARKLRQAISIAVNFDEFITIFMNGRGIVADGILPPGIFGYQSGQKGMNPYVYNWKNNQEQRKSIEYARKLLAEAGYPNGRNKKTGKQLILNFDTPLSGDPDDQARFNWFRKQFAKLGIQLNIRATQYNRFQEKIRTGNAQIFFQGWSADYPDPENFLFLLYGPNAKVKHGGENVTNYTNKRFDELFETMKSMPNNDQRLAIINNMLKIIYHDAPMVWGIVPKNFILAHQWVRLYKPHAIANNTLKYVRINPELRVQKQAEWNRPILWPVMVLLGVILIILIPMVYIYWIKEHKQTQRVDS